VTEGRIEERANMNLCNHGGHVEIDDVHDHRIVKQAETPSPLIVDGSSEIDEESGDEEEGGVCERKVAAETGGADETEPGDEDE
jgi:hypothetical protein